MNALSAVSISAVKVVGEKASSAIGNAHCAVNEDFEFGSGVMLTDFFYFIKGKFPCKHYSFYALASPKLNGIFIQGVGLGRKVYGQAWRNLFTKRNKTCVRYKNGVYTDIFQRLKVIFSNFEVAVFGEYVDGNVHFFTTSVAIFYAFTHFFKGEIVRISAERKFLTARINCVCAKVYGRL